MCGPNIINCRLEKKAISVEHVPVPCPKMPFGIICLMVGSVPSMVFMTHQSPFDLANLLDKDCLASFHFRDCVGVFQRVPL